VDDFDVFPGSEPVVIEGLANGRTGSILATSNATAKTFNANGTPAAADLKELLTSVRLAITIYLLVLHLNR